MFAGARGGGKNYSYATAESAMLALAELLSLLVCRCADLQEAFERVDHDGDGVINTAELEEIARSLNLNLSHSQAEAVVARFGNKGQI